MEDEFYHHGGAAHLAHTADKRTRLWRGFAYRISGPDIPAAGFLPSAQGRAGWSELPGRPRDPDHRRRPFIVYSEPLAAGVWLSVGQDRSPQILESRILVNSLLVSGVLAILFGASASYVASRRAWRGVAAIADTARRVEAGSLDVRAPIRPGPPADDVADLALTFNAMLDRTGALLGQVRQVSRDIAHDLRTPLTRVWQRLERLRLEAGDPAQAMALLAVEEDIAETLRIFDALLQLAEIEAAQTTSEPAFDLGLTLGRVAEAFRPDVEESGRTLTVSTPCVPLHGDERLVAQAVANLIENAMRHTPAGARITAEVEAGHTPRLWIQDDGPGIPAEARATVLRPLVRLESSRSSKGSGLGLSIVAAVAARHSARLELEDAKPGLRVALIFPDGSARPATAA